MARRQPGIQQTESKFEYGAKWKKKPRKFVYHRRKRRGEARGKFSHCWLSLIRCRRNNDTQCLSQPRNREAAYKKRQSRRTFEESWNHLYDWHKDPNTQNFGWSGTASIEDMSRKKSERKSHRGILSGLQRTYRTIRFFICEWQNCHPRRLEATTGGCIRLRITEPNKSGGRERHILVFGDQERHWQQV